MGQIIWRFSNEKAQWEKKEAGKEGTADALLYLDGREYQTMHGFGGCLNELGWQALERLSEPVRENVLRELFEPGEGRTNLNFCRVPIGANDYSFDWYSLDETPGEIGRAHV